MWIGSIKLTDVDELEKVVVKMIGGDEFGNLVYELPDWLIRLRRRVVARDTHQELGLADFGDTCPVAYEVQPEGGGIGGTGFQPLQFETQM